MTIACLVALGVWLVLSVANQSSRLQFSWVRRCHSLGLLPSGTFFTPDPVDIDHHLVVRDVDASGVDTPWQQVPVGAQREPFRAVWNPKDRVRWSLINAISGVAALASTHAPSFRNPDAIITISLPYLYILHLAMLPARTPGAKYRQFMIVETTGYGERRQVALGILSGHYAFDDAST